MQSLLQSHSHLQNIIADRLIENICWVLDHSTTKIMKLDLTSILTLMQIL